jgi:fructose-1-phosphate kinase PfkB-like protein
MINVWGDSVVCGIVAHLSRKEIEEDALRQQQAAAEAEAEVPKLNGNVTESIEMETTDLKKRSAVNADDNNSNIDF